MPYRITSLVAGNIYHIFNRGVEKRNIFTNDSDRNRFLKILQYYQIVGPKPRFSRFNPIFHKNLKTDKIIEIIAYCLMPNHFHLLLKQKTDKGITEFLGKISNSYTKYFNTKYKRVGPLFQGAFKAVGVSSDAQLLHLSRYIHLNPYVAEVVKDLRDYTWSSYAEFLGLSSNSITQKETILNFFSSTQPYEQFVLDHQDYALSLEVIKHQLLEEE